ncbi:MAG: hypothetical protein ACHQIL_01785 [Steroidobacterales bacterium]
MRNLKGIVFLLVLANVGYFLYARGIATLPFAPLSAPAPATLKLFVETAPPAAPKASSRCVSVGPFGELAELARAQATLRGGGYASRQRVTEADIADGVLVYVPLPATPAAAAQLRKKLKGAGVADAPEVSGPNDSTVVSLGSYSDAQRAQVRIAFARQLGLSPQSLERKHAGMAYWLDVDLKPSDVALNPADLHANTGNGVQLEVRECTAAPESTAASVATPGPPDASAAASAAR